MHAVQCVMHAVQCEVCYNERAETAEAHPGTKTEGNLAEDICKKHCVPDEPTPNAITNRRKRHSSPTASSRRSYRFFHPTPHCPPPPPPLLPWTLCFPLDRERCRSPCELTAHGGLRAYRFVLLCFFTRVYRVGVRSVWFRWVCTASCGYPRLG